jgi:hypothetical protein
VTGLAKRDIGARAASWSAASRSEDREVVTVWSGLKGVGIARLAP